MKRHCLPQVQRAVRGAEMVGLDLSNAIEAAYEKSRDVPTMHVVQSDIYNLPFRDDYFDFAQSPGVIHITPDPEAALLSVKQKVRPGRKFFIYVYPDFSGENWFRYNVLKIVNQIRRITIKLPSNLLYFLLYFRWAVVIAALLLASWFLWHVGLKKLGTVPLYNYDQYQGRRLRDIHMNLFDRLGNPVERRYSREEMNHWMQRAGFVEYELSFADGWTVAGVK